MQVNMCVLVVFVVLFSLSIFVGILMMDKM